MPMNEVIYEKRKELGLTQEQIAAYLGVSAPAVNKWEKGNTYPDITLLPALARLLKVDLNTLLCFQDGPSQQEIYYFRSENKKIHIVTKAGTEFFTGKLDQVASQVPQMLLLRIHKSYLVSYQHIAEFHYEHVKMANWDVLDISKAYRSQVRRQLLEYTAAEQGRGRL